MTSGSTYNRCGTRTNQLEFQSTVTARSVHEVNEHQVDGITQILYVTCSNHRHYTVFLKSVWLEFTSCQYFLNQFGWNLHHAKFTHVKLDDLLSSGYWAFCPGLHLQNAPLPLSLSTAASTATYGLHIRKGWIGLGYISKSNSSRATKWTSISIFTR